METFRNHQDVVLSKQLWVACSREWSRWPQMCLQPQLCCDPVSGLGTAMETVASRNSFEEK